MPTIYQTKDHKDVFTSVLHWISVKNLAGSLGSEVIAGNALTLAPVQHQLVAVFLLLQSESTVSSAVLCTSP